MEYLVGFLIGMAAGAAFVFLVSKHSRKQTEDTFSALSMKALSQNSENFLRLANETLSKQSATGIGELENKKKLIDQTLENIRGNLQKVETLVNENARDREKKFGELSAQLKATAEQTSRLQATTNNLNTALASTRIRGQWGERMAEDVLRLAGFIEGLNYHKQQTTENSRPDFTFLLPQNMKVNMDVKFPLDNYIRYVNEEHDSEREVFRAQFLRDCRQRIREVTSRNYINPEDNTVDYVLVFIPNEQVYSFINENNRDLLDEALTMKVIICSPLTLYAILVVIRQAVDNFQFERTASQMLKLFEAFSKQWDMFKVSMERMGKRIKDAGSEYDSLATTRTNQLERPLRQIDELRKQKGLDSLSAATDDFLPGAPEENAPEIDNGSR